MNTQMESYHSDDLATEGFDLHAGKSWVYPTNYPMREYQFRIAQEALYKNTLVSLPTGLGKTFIASVVMYNFYRWYPSGKIIFMAPTKPLVKQQIDACYDITGIPQNVTAELTGTKAQMSREEIWKTKRVFFITPQVLQNDIDVFPDLCKQIKCLVIDEAHKAKGNHAYCEVIRKLNNHSKYFRVLALSATPGNSTNDVIDMAMSLLISHLEVRTEESPDVAPYVFQRHLETIVVPLGGKLEEMRSKYLRVLERYVKVLKDNKIITGNCANLTKGKIFMTLKDFNLRSKYQRHPKHNEISRTLTVCITLYHGYELLIRHGMRGFLNFFDEHSKKSLLEGNSQLFAVMDEMQKYIGPRPDISLLPDGTIPQIEANSKFGHPKFYKLRNILLDYFANDENKESKVIIFSEFKETVMEAYAMLMQHPPIIRPKYFMGQGAITQKQQIKIIKSFREGGFNVLISTCIGEEGLDIGEVDLIICFDISNKSPIRLIQRIGRTGRKKQGQVIILVTEGKEQELLREALANKTNLSTNVLKSSEIPKHLYKENPRMVPENIFPTCNKMFISVPKVITKNKSGNIKDMFNNITKNETASQILKDIEIIEREETIPTSVYLWNQSDPLRDDLKLIGCNKPLDILRVYQPVENIQHSNNTDILVSLLQFVDAKRYNLPISQPTVLSQNLNRKRKTTKRECNDNFKQTDIRNLFIKPKTNLHEVENNVVSQEIKENAAKKKTESLTNNLFSEISSFLNICYDENKMCFFCEKTNLCKHLPEQKVDDFNPIDLTQLNISSIEALTEKDFDTYLQDLTIKTTIQDLNDVDFEHCFDEDVIVVDEESLRMETSKKENTFQFEPPKSIKKVIDSISKDINKTTIQDLNDIDFEKCFYEDVVDEESLRMETPKRENTFQFEPPKSIKKVSDSISKDINKTTIQDLNDVDFEQCFDDDVVDEESLRMETPKRENTCQFEPPKSIKKVIDSIKNINKTAIQDLNDVDFEQCFDEDFVVDNESLQMETPKKENTFQFEPPKTIKKGIESQNKENIEKFETKKCTDNNLDLFHLDSIDSLFDIGTNLNLECYSEKSSILFDNSLVNSPQEEEKTEDSRSSSPIFGTFSKKTQRKSKINLKTKLDSAAKSSFYVNKSNRISTEHKNMIEENLQENIYEKRNSNLSNYSEDLFDSPIMSTKLILNSPLEENKNDLNFNHNFDNSLTKNKNELEKELFSPTKQRTQQNPFKKRKISEDCVDLSIVDLCNESYFEFTHILTEPITKTNINKQNKKNAKVSDISNKNKLILSPADLNSGNGDNEFNSLSQILTKSTKNSDKNENINKEASQNEFLTATKKDKSYYSLFTNDIKLDSSRSRNDDIDLNISNICDISFFGFTQEPDENLPKNIDKPNDIIAIEDSPINNNSNALLISDDSLSPVYDYTNNVTTAKRTQLKRDFSQKSSEYVSKSITVIEEEQLSPVLSQKFKKSNKLKLKLQSSSINHAENVDENRKLNLFNLTDLTESNANNLSQSKNSLLSNKNEKIGAITFDLLDDDNAFENCSYKTPIKSMSTKKLTLKTPKSNKKITEISLFNTDAKNEKTPKSSEEITRKRICFTSSDDEFEEPSGWYQKQLASVSTRRNECNVTPKGRVRKKKLKNPFIDDEAEISSEERGSDDSEFSGTQDSYNSSFVTQTNILNTTSMHLKYLESVKSPLQLNGRFKIPDRPKNQDIDVFSQKENIQDNSYLEDSFCVNISESQLPVDKDLSELEIAERLLEENKKHTKNKRKYKDKNINSKKRRIIILSDSE